MQTWGYDAQMCATSWKQNIPTFNRFTLYVRVGSSSDKEGFWCIKKNKNKAINTNAIPQINGSSAAVRFRAV